MGRKPRYRDPWERQLHESAKAFEGFRKYRSLGVTRSLAKVGQALGKSTALMERWSARWDWVERAEAWDFEQDRLLRAEQNDAIRQMADRHTKLAMMVLHQVATKLNSFLGEDGQPDPKKLADLKPRDLARLMDLAVKVERLSRGAPTDLQDLVIGGKDGAKILTEVVFVKPDPDPGGNGSSNGKS